MLPDRVRRLIDTAQGMAMLTYGVMRLGRLMAINTRKRILGMTAPGGTPELNEAIDAGFDVALRIKKAMAADSAGGKQVTLDEMLHSVSDGDVRASMQKLVNAIESIVRGERPDIFDLIPTVVEAILEFLGVLRDALADKRITPDEILAGVSTQGLRPVLQKAIDGLDKIPGEMSGMDMWKMMGLVQRVTARLPELLAK